MWSLWGQGDRASQQLFSVFNFKIWFISSVFIPLIASSPFKFQLCTVPTVASPLMCIWTPGRVSVVTSSFPHQPLRLLGAAKVKGCTERTRLWLSGEAEAPPVHRSSQQPFQTNFNSATSAHILPNKQIQANRPEDAEGKQEKYENMAKGAEVRGACQLRGRTEDHWDLIDTGEPSGPSYLLQKCPPPPFYCCNFQLDGWQRDHHFVKETACLRVQQGIIGAGTRQH